METTGGGTAILVALAAVLWIAYLVPVWRRRAEYLATERNAIRLQQTLRIMAHTAEVPEQVRAELHARDIAQRERSLAARQREEAAIARAREAAAQRALRQRLAESAPGLMAEVDAARLGQRRLRRSRALTSLVTLLAVVGVVISVLSAAWAWLALSGFVAVSGGLLLRGLARASTRRSSAVSVAAPPFRDLAPSPARGAARAAAPSREWTPVPLPKPSYLSAPVVPSGAAAPALDHAAALAAAAAEAERAQRAVAARADADAAAIAAARSGASVPGRVTSTSTDAPSTTTERPAASASRFASMGLLDGVPTRAPNLDEVLERRRAAS